MDVKACYAMREAFALLDYSDPDIVDIKRLLLQVNQQQLLSRPLCLSASFSTTDASALLPSFLTPSPVHDQAAFNPAFVHRPEGRRFLASLFNLDRQLVTELTATIKNQVRREGP